MWPIRSSYYLKNPEYSRIDSPSSPRQSAPESSPPAPFKFDTYPISSRLADIPMPPHTTTSSLFDAQGEFKRFYPTRSSSSSHSARTIKDFANVHQVDTKWMLEIRIPGTPAKTFEFSDQQAANEALSKLDSELQKKKWY